MSKKKTLPYCEEIVPYKLTTWQKIYSFLKNAFDFIFSLVSVILFSLLFFGIAIAIKIESKGPVFFKQQRIGKNGKLFNCLKFRTMSLDANHNIAGYEYSDVQKYITKVGKFLRKTSIDELPQLLNVLSGKMSLIGYRPSQNNELDLMAVREGFQVYQLRPGITGWAQINGRDILAAKPVLKAKYDGYYLKHFSFRLDVKIFFLTLISVFKKCDQVEGIVEDNKDNTENDQTK